MRPSMHVSQSMAVGLWFALAWPGCAGEPADGRGADEGEPPAARSQAIVVPAKGAPDTFDVASWNVEFFGDTGSGPTNDTLQRANTRDVIAGADMDIWGLAEIVSTSGFNALKAQLPGYAGFLANDPLVLGGSASYGSSEQKVGLLFKTSVASVVGARVILAERDFDFAGRPPLQVTLRVTLNGTTEDVVVIVLHAKCCSDGASLQRRRNAAGALKGYLDSASPAGKVWVIGDFNDDLDASITPGNASPYAAFVNDPNDYRFATQALTDAGVSSTVEFPEMIDHHLNTNESHALYLGGSAEVYRVDEFIANYGTTTSDHFPVLSRYTWGQGGGAAAGAAGAAGPRSSSMRSARTSPAAARRASSSSSSTSARPTPRSAAGRSPMASARATPSHPARPSQPAGRSWCSAAPRACPGAWPTPSWRRPAAWAWPTPATR